MDWRYIWEICMDIIEIAITYDFLIRYFGYRLTGWFRCVGTVCYVLPSLIILTFLSPFFLLQIEGRVCVAVVNFIFCLVFLKGDILEKAFVSFYIMGLVCVVSSFSLLVVSMFHEFDVYHILSILDTLRMVANGIMKVLFFILTRMILRWKRDTALKLREFFILEGIVLFSIVGIAFFMIKTLKNPHLEGITLTIIGMVATMNVVIYFLFLYISRINRLNREYAILQLQYFNQQKSMEEIQQLYKVILSLHHDMKNHLASVDYLAERGKYDEIHRYIRTLKNIEIESQFQFFYTGNDIIDAILNTKLAMAEKLRIQHRVAITYVDIPMELSDISVLLGNLLDNACEAAAKAEKKNIEVRIRREDEYVFISVCNTMVHSVLENNPNLLTTKNEQELHGFGVRNIKKIVNQYNGIIRYHEEAGMFICDVFIPLVQRNGIIDRSEQPK